MRPEVFDELLRDVPDQVRLSPQAAWEVARRRRLRRRVIAASAFVAVVVGGAIGLQQLRGNPEIEPTPSPGAKYVRAERVKDGWDVLRSDGTRFRVDTHLGYDGATLGLSPDGLWLSYVQGPESGSIVDLYLLRSDRTEPVRAPQVSATWGFAHLWSPDSSLVLVPVPDGDVNLVDTEAELVDHQGSPGTIAGFTDNDSLGWIFAEGSRGDEGLTWLVTNLETTAERTLPLHVGRDILNPRGWPQLMLEQASLSPDRSRVAVLLANYRGQAQLIVFSTTRGALLSHQDVTEDDVDLDCPLRWEAGDAVLTRAGETCTVQPG